MALKFNCPRCGSEIVVKHLKKGEIAKCFACGSEVPVPEEALEGEFEKPDYPVHIMRLTKDADQGEAVVEGPKLVGLRGWLIIPAIGFILGPTQSAIALFMAIGLYSVASEAGFGGIFSMELFVASALLLFTIYAAILFFGKKRNAPSIIIWLLITSIVSSAALLFIELIAGADTFAIQNGKLLILNIIGAAIWIPYFKVSERVKATFVK